MFGMMEALLSYFRRQIGLRSDLGTPTGSLHAKVRGLYRPGLLLPLEGVGVDGDFNPVSNTTLTMQTYQFNNFIIPAGVTVTVARPGAAIFAKSITISGLLTASGQGGVGGAANTATSGENGAGYIGGGGGGGGSYNGWAEAGKGGNASGLGGGNTGGQPGQVDQNKIIIYKDLLSTLGGVAGAGGGAGRVFNNVSGAGGAGGGVIILCSQSITINPGGAVRADGLNGGTVSMLYAGNGGGGGGGGIILIANSINDNGVISATGGNGGTGTSAGTGGGGGAGRIIKVVL